MINKEKEISSRLDRNICIYNYLNFYKKRQFLIYFLLTTVICYFSVFFYIVKENVVSKSFLFEYNFVFFSIPFVLILFFVIIVLFLSKNIDSRKNINYSFKNITISEIDTCFPIDSDLVNFIKCSIEKHE